jgi:hypothetical protein
MKRKKGGAKTPSLLHNREHGDGSACALFMWKQAHIKKKIWGGGGGGAWAMVGSKAPLLAYTHNQREKKGVEAPLLLYNEEHHDGNGRTCLLWKQTHIKK